MIPRIDTPLELKRLGQTGCFEGYAAVFNVTDNVNDKILPGARSLQALARERGDRAFHRLPHQ